MTFCSDRVPAIRSVNRHKTHEKRLILYYTVCKHMYCREPFYIAAERKVSPYDADKRNEFPQSGMYVGKF